VQEFVAPPSEEPRRKSGTAAESGKPTAVRVKTEPVAKQEASPEKNAGKPVAASQVRDCYYTAVKYIQGCHHLFLENLEACVCWRNSKAVGKKFGRKQIVRESCLICLIPEIFGSN